MSQLSKIVVTIVVVVLFVVLFGAIVGSMQGSTPGIFGLIVFAALIGALRAIWKKPENEDENNNNAILQK